MDENKIFTVVIHQSRLNISESGICLEKQSVLFQLPSTGRAVTEKVLCVQLKVSCVQLRVLCNKLRVLCVQLRVLCDQLRVCEFS
jgi:hypothetical protein